MDVFYVAWTKQFQRWYVFGYEWICPSPLSFLICKVHMDSHQWNWPWEIPCQLHVSWFYRYLWGHPLSHRTLWLLQWSPPWLQWCCLPSKLHMTHGVLNREKKKIILHRYRYLSISLLCVHNYSYVNTHTKNPQTICLVTHKLKVLKHTTCTHRKSRKICWKSNVYFWMSSKTF